MRLFNARPETKQVSVDELSFVDFTNRIPTSSLELNTGSRVGTASRQSVIHIVSLLLASRLTKDKDIAKTVKDLDQQDYYLEQMTANGSKIFVAAETADNDALLPEHIHGALFLRKVQRGEDHPLGVLEAMTVSKASRGQGIAKFMLYNVVDYAREAGLARIELHASNNTEDMYRKLVGAESLGPVPGYSMEHMSIPLSLD